MDQTACKPGSVPPPCGDAAIIPLDRPSRDGSRDLPGALRPATALPLSGRGIPIRSCSWRGLPCGPCYQGPGALLPHPFTLPFDPGQSPRRRRSALCGAIPRVTPGGRYPPPCRRGARTFLDPLAETATAQPSDPRRPWSLTPPRSTGYRIHTSANRHRCCAATELLSPGATRREGEGWERAGS